MKAVCDTIAWCKPASKAALVLNSLKRVLEKRPLQRKRGTMTSKITAHFLSLKFLQKVVDIQLYMRIWLQPSYLIFKPLWQNRAKKQQLLSILSIF